MIDTVGPIQCPPGARKPPRGPSTRPATSWSVVLSALLALLLLCGAPSARAACEMQFDVTGAGDSFGDPLVMHWDLDLYNAGSTDCTYQYGNPNVINFMGGPSTGFTNSNLVYTSATIIASPPQGGSMINPMLYSGTGGTIGATGVSGIGTQVIFRPGEHLTMRVVTSSLNRVCTYHFPAFARRPEFTNDFDVTGRIDFACGSPSLVTSKTASAATVRAGAPISWTVHLSNAGSAEAPGATLTDTVPAGVTGISAVGNGLTCSVAGQSVTCSTPSLPGNTHVSATISGTAPLTAGTITNTCAVASAPWVPVDNTACRAVTTVTESADLRITKADAVDPVFVGAAIDYTLTVSNLGPTGASGITVSDTLPTGTSFVSAAGAGWSCGQAGATLTCTLPSLANGATAPGIAVRVNAPTAAGTVTNTASVTATSADPNTANNQASESTTVENLRTDLVFTKTASAPAVSVGDTYSYTITVVNNGPSAATNVRFTDVVPASVEIRGVAGTGWTCSTAGQTVNCLLPTLAAGASSSVTISARALSAGNVTNTCTGTSDTADPQSNDSCSVTTTVADSADLSVSKTDAVDPVFVGSSIVYTLSVSNAGPSAAANLTLSDLLPANLTFVSAVGSGWLCSNAGQNVACTRASLGIGATAPPVTLTVTAPSAPGLVSNTATIGSTTPDPQPANNQSTQSTTVQALSADLAITKTDAVDPVLVGSSIDYTLAVTNAGPSPATSLTVTDNLPTGTTFISAAGTGWTCARAGQTVTCTLATLASGAAAAPIQLRVTAPSTPGTVDNTASVSSTTADPNSANNSDSEKTGVNAVADLALRKSVAAATVNLGATTTWTVDVTNTGPQPATNIVITDPMPARFQPTTASGAGWSCTLTGQNTVCSRASLASGATASFAIQARAVSVGLATNTCSKTANEADNNPANDTCSATTSVVDYAVVSVTKSAPTTVLTGASITWALTVKNEGPSPATNVVVTDTLPANVTNISASGPAPWSCSTIGSTATCTAGTLPVGTTVISVTGTAPSSPGPITNTCVMSATVGAPDASGCRATTDVLRGPDLEVTKSHTPTTMIVGRFATYALSVRNVGDTATSGSYVLFDQLPVGLDYAGANGTGWSCTEAGRAVTCSSSAVLAPGASATPLSIDVTPTVAAIPVVVNDARVSGGGDRDGMPDCTTAAPGTKNCARDIAPVLGVPSLELSKTHAPSRCRVGEACTFLLTVSNVGSGDTDGTAIEVLDPLPSGLSFVSAAGAGWTCNAKGSDLACIRTAIIARGSSSVITIVTLPSASAIPEVVNSASAHGGGDDGPLNCASNEDPRCATDTVPVDGVPDLTISKGHTPATFVQAGQGTYRLTITNIGTGDTDGAIAVTDWLPADITFIASDSSSNVTCGMVASQLSCTTGDVIPAGASIIVDVRVLVAAAAPPGTRVNVARVEGGGDGDPIADCPATPTAPNCATDTVSLGTGPNLELAKTHTPVTFRAGGQGRYTLTVRNVGDQASAGVFTIDDTLPAGTAYASSTSADGLVCSAVSQALHCEANIVLPVGGTASVEIVVDILASAADAVTNIARVAGGGDHDPVPDCIASPTSANCAIDTAAVGRTALRVAKSHSPTTFTAGGVGRYDVIVSNTGSLDSIGEIVVVDTLPVGLTYLSFSAQGGFVCAGLGQLVTCRSSESLAAGSSALIALDVSVAATAPALLTNVAGVGGGGDPEPPSDCTVNPTAVNCATDDTPVGHVALNVAKTHTPAIMPAGGQGVFTIAITNAGDQATQGTVRVVDTLPAGMTFVTATGDLGLTCTAISQIVTCTTSQAIVAGATARILVTVDVAPTASGTLTNVVGVHGGGDPTPEPDCVSNPAAANCASDDVPVDSSTTLTVAKTHTPARFQAGGTGTYSIRVTNSGRAQTRGVVSVRDVLPTGMTYVDAVGEMGFSCDGSSVIPLDYANETDDVVTCTTATPFAPGAHADITMTVAISRDAIGTLVNIVGVHGPSDPEPNCTLTPLPANCAIDPTDVDGLADLRVSKTHTPGTFVVGQPGTYTVAVRNAGTAPTTGRVEVNDTLPQGLAFVSASGELGFGCVPTQAGFSCSTTQAIAAGATATISVRVSVGPQAIGTVVNRVGVAGPDDPTPDCSVIPMPPNCAEDPTDIVGTAVLSLVKTHTPAVFHAGAQGTYHLAITNVGTVAAQPPIALVDMLPEGFSFVSATSDADFTCGAVGQVVGCGSASAIPAGATRTVDIVVAVSPTASGTVINRASVAPGGDPQPDCSSQPMPPSCAGDPTIVSSGAQLIVRKTHTPQTFVAGRPGTYSISVTNQGTGFAAGPIRVVDTLPPGMTLIAATPSGGFDCSGSTIVACTTPQGIAAGATVAIDLQVDVAATAIGTLVNRVSVGGTDTPPTDCTALPMPPNCASDPTDVASGALLRVRKTHSPTIFIAGTRGTYAITVTNAGNGPTSGATEVRDSLPPGMTMASFSATNGFACEGTTVVVCRTSQSLSAGDSAQIDLTVDVAANAQGTLTNLVSVGGGGDPTDCTTVPIPPNCAGDPTEVEQRFNVALSATRHPLDPNDALWPNQPSQPELPLGVEDVVCFTATNTGAHPVTHVSLALDASEYGEFSRVASSEFASCDQSGCEAAALASRQGLSACLVYRVTRMGTRSMTGTVAITQTETTYADNSAAVQVVVGVGPSGDAVPVPALDGAGLAILLLLVVALSLTAGLRVRA